MKRAPEKPTLLRWAYRFAGKGRIALAELVKEGARIALRKSLMDAEAYAEANSKAFWTYLAQAQQRDERRGLTRMLNVVDPAALVLEWYSTPINSCSKDIRRAASISQRPLFLTMIDDLSSREYEALACVAMRLVGAAETTTPAGNEGGVDFFALWRAPARCHLLAGSNNPVRIVGQSKKYATPLGGDAVKEFITTLAEVKHGGQLKTERIIPSWFRENPGPIVGCIISHHGFQEGALSRARNHGILVADSIDLAEMLALSRGVPQNLTPGDRVLQCRDFVAELLTK